MHGFSTPHLIEHMFITYHTFSTVPPLRFSVLLGQNQEGFCFFLSSASSSQRLWDTTGASRGQTPLCGPCFSGAGTRGKGFEEGWFECEFAWVCV